jgi:hypothetical protein
VAAQHCSFRILAVTEIAILTLDKFIIESIGPLESDKKRKHAYLSNCKLPIQRLEHHEVGHLYAVEAFPQSNRKS